jgi:ABC-type sugar transport system permease subunit
MSRLQRNLYGGWGMIALLLAPALVLLGLFVFYPAVDAIIVSLSSWSGFAPRSQFIGLENYRSLLFTDARFWASFRHTLYYVVIGGIVQFTFALLFSWGLSHPRLRGKKVYQTLLFFPAFISVAGVATLWARLYDPKDGLINRLLVGCHLDALLHTLAHAYNWVLLTLHLPDGWLVTGPDPSGVTWLSPANAVNSIIIASVWAGVGGEMILLLAGMRRIPASYHEAARIDGASEARVFWHVTLPMLKDVAYIAVTLWLIGSLQVFGLVQALAGPEVHYEMETVATYQYAISFNNRSNIYMMGRGTAMALLLVTTAVILAAIARLIFGKRELEY